MNLKHRGFKLLAGGMAVLFSYTTVSVSAWAGTASFPQVMETLDTDILKSETMSELSHAFENAVTSVFSILKEELPQEDNRALLSEMDGGVNTLNLRLAGLGAELRDLKNYAAQVGSSTVANNMARNLMHEFYFRHLLKRFHEKPFKKLSAKAKIHAFHVINEHIKQGDVASFLKEIELLEEQTSQGMFGAAGFAWPSLAVGGFVMLILLIWYYSKEENSLGEDWSAFWTQVKKFFCE